MRAVCDARVSVPAQRICGRAVPARGCCGSPRHHALLCFHRCVRACVCVCVFVGLLLSPPLSLFSCLCADLLSLLDKQGSTCSSSVRSGPSTMALCSIAPPLTPTAHSSSSSSSSSSASLLQCPQRLALSSSSSSSTFHSRSQALVRCVALRCVALRK